MRRRGMEYLKNADPYVTQFLSPALKSCSFLHGSVGMIIRKHECCVQRKTRFGSFEASGSSCTNCVAVGSCQRDCASLRANILSRKKIIQSTSLN